MQQDRMVAWCTLFLTIVGKDAPENALDEDLEERERAHFWKAKKWAYANLNRLFVRYGHPSPVSCGITWNNFEGQVREPEPADQGQRGLFRRA